MVKILEIVSVALGFLFVLNSKQFLSLISQLHSDYSIDLYPSLVLMKSYSFQYCLMVAYKTIYFIQTVTSWSNSLVNALKDPKLCCFVRYIS